MTVKPKIHKQKAAITSLTVNVASLAMGLEALETLLVEKGVLRDNELLERIKTVSTEHYSKGEFLPASED